VKVILKNLRFGTEWFGEYAQWHSDKTAKTGFVGFGIFHLADFQDLFSGGGC
jgi:hypothetical protein